MTGFFRSAAFEGASRAVVIREAQGLARLLKKAGTSADDARERIQKKYELSRAELRAVVRSVWGDSALEGVDDPDYIEAKARRDELEAEVNQASLALKKFDRDDGPMNLLPEHIRLSPEYRAAKARFDKAFAALRAFNTAFVKRFKREIREDSARRRRGA